MPLKEGEILYTEKKIQLKKVGANPLSGGKFLDKKITPSRVDLLGKFGEKSTPFYHSNSTKDIIQEGVDFFVAKKSKVRLVKTKKSTFKKSLIKSAPRFPDEYYIQQHTVPVQSSKMYTPSFDQEEVSSIDLAGSEVQENLSRDKIFDELARFDERDLEIQEKMRKDRYSYQPRARRHNAVSLASISEKSPDNKKIEKKLEDFDLRPFYGREEKGRRQISLPIKKILLFFVFVAASVSIGSSLSLFMRGGISERFDIQDSIFSHAREGYSSLDKGRDALLSLDSSAAEKHFSDAYNEFSRIENKLGFASRGALYTASLLPFKSKMSSASYLLNAGKSFSQAGIEASYTLGPFEELRSSVDSIGTDTERGWAFNSHIPLTEKILEASEYLENAQFYIEKSAVALSMVRAVDVPEEFSEEFADARKEVIEIDDLFRSVHRMMNIPLIFLGHEDPKTYLIVFQNSSELRATGGFIGTYGLLKLNKGSVEDLFIEGIYYPDGQLSVDVIPPEPLQYVTPNWGTRDANWFFDFPTSANTLTWFFEKTGSDNVDGVIAINPIIVEKLLSATGQIEMSEYNTVITSETFLEIVQKEVEEDYNKELNRPKQILSDFAPKLLERTIEDVDPKELIDIFSEGLTNKNIILYSNDNLVQSFFQDKLWSGSISEQNPDPNVLADYLAVVISNIKGGKTDKYTDTEIDTVTHIESDGSVVRTVAISRKHNGGSTPYKWYNRDNSAYVRIYVPLGSTFISAEGFSPEPPRMEIDYEALGYIEDPTLALSKNSLRKDSATNTDIFIESGKTVLGNWLIVKPGEKKIAQISYRLPRSFTDGFNSYDLLIQKQSGIDAFYSGLLGGANDDISFDSCKVGYEEIDSKQFKFVQTRDTLIRCDIIHH